MKTLLIILCTVVITAGIFSSVEAKGHSRWPATYIECLWKALDYLDTMSANMQRQADDLHAMREKLAK